MAPAHPEDGPEEGAEAVVAPAPEAAAQPAEAEDGGDQGTGHAAGPAAGSRFLDVDPAIGLRKERPGQAVQEYADAGEEGEDNEEAADDQRVDSHAVGNTAGDAADPPVLATADAVAADPAEEVRLLAGHTGIRIAAGVRRGVGAGRRAGVGPAGGVLVGFAAGSAAGSAGGFLRRFLRLRGRGGWRQGLRRMCVVPFGEGLRWMAVIRGGGLRVHTPNPSVHGTSALLGDTLNGP
jgi:hypothetical protein